MVHDVLNVGPELQSLRLRNRERLLDVRIEAEDSWIPEYVAAQVSTNTRLGVLENDLVGTTGRDLRQRLQRTTRYSTTIQVLQSCDCRTLRVSHLCPFC